jgi:hypothetical protein
MGGAQKLAACIALLVVIGGACSDKKIEPDAALVRAMRSDPVFAMSLPGKPSGVVAAAAGSARAIEATKHWRLKNADTAPAFDAALRQAREAGVSFANLLCDRAPVAHGTKSLSGRTALVQMTQDIASPAVLELSLTVGMNPGDSVLKPVIGTTCSLKSIEAAGLSPNLPRVNDVLDTSGRPSATVQH